MLSAVRNAQQKLGLMFMVEVYYDNRGIAVDDPRDSPRAKEVAEELASDPASNHTLRREFFEHPDGIRACKVAFELR
jgi:hypothetical protein